MDALSDRANMDEELVIGEEEGFDKWEPSKLAYYVLQHVLTPVELRETPELIEKVTKVFTEHPPDIMTISLEEWESYLEHYQLISELVVYAKQHKLPPGRINPVITLIGDIPEKLRDKQRGMTPFATLEKSFKRVHKYDMIFKEDENWCIEKAERPYFSPSGWRRYGFYPDIPGESEEMVEEIMQKWHVAYHGSSGNNIDSIVLNGLLPPGAVVNGKELASLHGTAGAEGKKSIYLSPSIMYSSHWAYTNPSKYKDPKTGEFFYYYYVLQVRVKPGSFRVQGNTLWKGGWEDKAVAYDPRFGTDELEWLFDGKNADCIRVTGLMVRKTKDTPQEEVKKLYEKNRKVFDERHAAPGTGTWYYNSAASTGSTLSQSGPWATYNAVSNAIIEKAYQSGQSVAFLGGIDTPLGQLRYYVDFQVMEQRRVDDATLRRLIKRQ